MTSLKQQLQDAAEAGDLQLVKDLVSKGAGVPKQSIPLAIMNAADAGHADVLEFLLAQPKRQKSSDFMSNALQCAFKNAHRECVRILLEEHKDDEFRRSALRTVQLLAEDQAAFAPFFSMPLLNLKHNPSELQKMTEVLNRW